MGFTADGSGTPDPTDANQERRNRLTFGGSDSGPNGNSAQQAANAYALKANQHDSRQAYQLNYGQANQSFDQANADRAQAGQARNQQQDALALQQQAAMGQQPSRAELLGRGLIDQSLQSQLAGAASARGGPLAQMAAQRQVQQNAAGFQQQGMGQLAAMRAGEMADARNAYMQGATGIRGQDYAGAQQAAQMAGQQAQMAQAQGQLEMGQRQLNQQGEEAYDQMGWNTLNSQADRNLQEYQQAEQHWANQANLNQQSKRDSQNLVGQIVGGAAEAVGSIFSDERAKIPISIDGTSSDGGAMDISEGGATGAGMLASMTGRGADGQPGTIGGGGMVGGKVNLGAAGDVQGFGSPSKAAGRGMQGFGRHLMSISDERAKSKADDIIGGYKKSLAEGPAVGGGHAAAADDIIAGYKDSLARGPTVRPEDDPQLQAMLDDRFRSEQQRAGVRPEWLDAYMDEQQAPRKLAYGGPEKGVAGAPKGYAAARAAKQGGYAWGDTAKEDEDRGVAPGTTDYERSTPKLKESEKPLLLSIGRGLRGFGHSMMYSDERAKQAAYQAGARDALGAQSRSQVEDQNDLANSALGYSAISPAVAAVQAVRSIGKGIDSYRSQRAAEGYQPPPEPRTPRQPEGSGVDMLEITHPLEASQRAPRQMESFTREPVAEVQKDANRRGAGFAYAYKDGFRPPEQAPGELNYGPSAQQLEKNPLTATAVKTDPKSGMRMLDTHKLLKNNTASIASLQKQIDNLEARNGR